MKVTPKTTDDSGAKKIVGEPEVTHDTPSEKSCAKKGGANDVPKKKVLKERTSKMKKDNIPKNGKKQAPMRYVINSLCVR